MVEMNNPGVWVFGSVKDDERKMGMGVVVSTRTRTANRNGNRPRT